MLLLLSLAALLPLAAPAAAQPGFGVKDLAVAFEEEGGVTAEKAGSHPYAFTTTIDVNTSEGPGGGQVPIDAVKDIVIDLPPGVVADSGAVPVCPAAVFLASADSHHPTCPNATVVGLTTVEVGTTGPSPFSVPVYNMTAPHGAVLKFGFIALGVPVTFEAGLRPTPPYNGFATIANIPQAINFYGSKTTIWGDPSDESHDALRGNCLDGSGKSKGLCHVSSTGHPFLTLPRSCSGPLTTSFPARSWQDPSIWLTQSVQSAGMGDCASLSFDPKIDAVPSSDQASSPSGLAFNLDISDEGLTSPAGRADSDIRSATVTLPVGMTANPALAEGLAGCSEADLARESAESPPGVGCPSESKIGTVEVETPLLEQTLKGSLFVASPYANPFGSLLGLYVVIKDPQTGVLIKLAGKVVPNETTGQLVSVFDDLPQLPFGHFRLHFREGQRSPLVTPPACGTYTTTADLTPWANPEAVLHDTATFQITAGVAGAPCPNGGVPPFKPVLVAGTLNNNAGAYSPLRVRLTRNDGEQEITGFSSLLPPGVTANLNGVPFCSEAQISQAKSKSGAQEQTEPSCPQASEIGHTLVGVGVGPVLAYTPGKLYMAGPYEGAPFSVVAITSAKVGPFDLGTVVVHLPLNIDPVTARVSIPAGAADQIPHIVKGIVVHVRDIRVYVDRPGFTINPTNCDPLTFAASVIGSGQSFATPTDDVTVGVNAPFQAANCANLAFKPSFKVTTRGKTSRSNGASLSVKLTYPKAPQGTQANVKSVKVDLPKQLPSRLTTLQKACTAEQFEANPAGCPVASRVGSARAITPILPEPITGPAYFVSHGGSKFPELIIVLQGYGVTIDLHGETFINKAGITSSTFHTVPDQPVTSFELTLPQGPNSALAANGNLCNITSTKTVKRKVTVRSRNGGKRTVTRTVATTVPGTLTMPTTFTGQNGAVVKQNTRIEVTGCARKKAKKAATSRRRRRGK